MNVGSIGVSQNCASEMGQLRRSAPDGCPTACCTTSLADSPAEMTA